jgi:hypothetical protein
MVLLWRMDVHTTNGQAARNMIVAGLGIGAMMQVFVLSVQNAVPRSLIGAATALTQFARQMGATIGVTVIGAIVNHGLPRGVTLGEGTGIHRLPAAQRAVLARAIHPAFLVTALAALGVWLISVRWVKEQPLRRSLDEVSAADAAAGAPATAPLD